jgi:hypothetical protein
LFAVPLPHSSEYFSILSTSPAAWLTYADIESDFIGNVWKHMHVTSYNIM